MSDEERAALIAAARLLAENEWVGLWAESENEHSLQHRLRDLADALND